MDVHLNIDLESMDSVKFTQSTYAHFRRHGVGAELGKVAIEHTKVQAVRNQLNAARRQPARAAEERQHQKLEKDIRAHASA